MSSPETDADGPFKGLPGHPMMWILIVSELLVFGGGLLAFSGARLGDAAGFASAQGELNRISGLINMMVLITSGLFAALAVEALKAGNLRHCRIMLAVAAAFGVVFLGFKAHEYWVEIAQGYTLMTSPFWTLYYLITGFHALHVVLGLIILALVALWPSRINVETGAAFWHMVDLVWLMVFPVVYLIR